MFRAISTVRAQLRPFPQTLTLSPFALPLESPHSVPPIPSISILSSPFTSTPPRRRQGDDDSSSSDWSPKLFVVQPRLRPATALQAKLDEALNLANPLEEQRDVSYGTEFFKKELPGHVVLQNPAARSTHADTFFGKGTLKTVKCHLNAVDSEHAWGKPILDCVGLIIEIFRAHAQTKEGKLQAELAALMYKRTRLVRLRVSGGRSTFGGEAEVVSARGCSHASSYLYNQLTFPDYHGLAFLPKRSTSFGKKLSLTGEEAGDVVLSVVLAKLNCSFNGERRKQLLPEIEDVRRTRALQRAARKRHGGSRGQDMATVAVVGYTNAGKSTLVSTLSGSHLYSDDRLFATVDPKLRSVVLPSGRKLLLSDTVGFISELPVQVEAFHATLEEVAEADLLVHVVDSSAPNLDEQRDTVLQVLEQIGLSEEKLQNMIKVRNKIDLEKEEMGADDCGEENEAGSDSGAEDDDTAPEQLHDENNCNVSLSSSQDLEEATDDEQCDCSDGWVSPGDDGGASKDQRKESSKDWKIMRKDSISQYKSVAHVKTSAVTGVGLQELLALIDKKLAPQKVLERDVFDRKWRPPRGEDTGIAVEQ